jgi:hypothetical protein
VVKCVGFDDLSSINELRGGVSGVTTGVARPVLDNTTKASGGASLRFAVPSNSGPNSSGSYFTNFSDDLSVRFGGQSEFYIQWRQRFSRELLNTRYQGGHGWKQLIVGSGDRPGTAAGSCTALEIVVNSYLQNGFPTIYNSCTGSTSHGPYDGFYEPIESGSNFRLQNARPAPYCLYSQRRTSFFPPAGNCFGYVADEWMTFQLGVKIGPRVGDEFTNSRVMLWMARQSRPSELVIDWGPYNLSAGEPREDQRFGKVWLLPYHTGKAASQAHPVAYTWYDELIISRSRIPDPQSGSP